jgi:hypothetical protein
VKDKLFIALLLLLVACNDDNNDNSGGSYAPNLTTQLNNDLPGDSWIITEFIDDDETDEYDGFTFDFAPDSTLTATRTSDSTVVIGTWFTLFDDGQTELWINFPNSGDPRFDELTEDWCLISANDQLIRLREDDDNDDDDDLLRFER